MARCARRGCTGVVPVVALLAGDPFCSSGCFRVANGHELAPQATTSGNRRTAADGEPTALQAAARERDAVAREALRHAPKMPNGPRGYTTAYLRD